MKTTRELFIYLFILRDVRSYKLLRLRSLFLDVYFTGTGIRLSESAAVLIMTAYSTYFICSGKLRNRSLSRLAQLMRGETWQLAMAAESVPIEIE